MTLPIPCGRWHTVSKMSASENEGVRVACQDGALCPHCNAILILKAACLGVADRLDNVRTMLDSLVVEESIGRLCADVARVESQGE